MQYGEPPAQPRWFSFPRSVETLAGGGLLVCDTAHDRVVVAENGAHNPWPLERTAQLFWPRCARMLPSGSLLVADGRNGRVLEVAPSGEVLRGLDQLDGGLPLDDPHDVRLLPNGPSADHRCASRARRRGRLGRADLPDGRRRRRPSAQQTAQRPAPRQRFVLVCDSGNHRVLWVGADGESHRTARAPLGLRSVFGLAALATRRSPPPGVLVVADTGNNRVARGRGVRRAAVGAGFDPRDPAPVPQPTTVGADDHRTSEVVVSTTVIIASCDFDGSRREVAPPADPISAFPCKTGRESLESTADGGPRRAEAKPARWHGRSSPPTGEFELRAFEYPSGYVYVVLVKGELGDGSSVLTRVHSECLTGDALGSRRCDCGLQLRNALRAIGRRDAACWYTRPGRGPRSRARQQAARIRPAGERTRHGRCEPSAGVRRRRARLCGGGAMPGARRRPLGAVAHEQSPQGRRSAEKGIEVDEVVSLDLAPRSNLTYLRSKQGRLGHAAASVAAPETIAEAVDVHALFGQCAIVLAPICRAEVRADARRAHRVAHRRQQMDQWRGGAADLSRAAGNERRRARRNPHRPHRRSPADRARLFPGSHPLRVILDSTLRSPE